MLSTAALTIASANCARNSNPYVRPELFWAARVDSACEQITCSMELALERRNSNQLYYPHATVHEELLLRGPLFALAKQRRTGTFIIFGAMQALFDSVR